MASHAPYRNDHSSNGPPRKRIKLADIPIPSATRDAIQSLALTFKKKGGYDSLRKQAWEDLKSSDFEAEFTGGLRDLAEEELERAPATYLKQDANKATALLEGVLERKGLYEKIAEREIDKLLDAQMPEIEKGIYALRREAVGQEQAEAERLRGSKTDEEYDEYYANKRAEREENRQKMRAEEREAAEEKKRVHKAKRLEEEQKLLAAQERRKEQKAAERKAEMEAEEAKEKKRAEDREERARRDRERDRERERERDRDRDRDRHRDRERPRERDRDRDRGRDDRSRRYDDDHSRRKDSGRDNDHRRRESIRDDDYSRRKDSGRDRDTRRESREATIKDDLPEDATKRLEQEALDDLLREGRAVSERPTGSRRYLDIDRNLAPPPRKAMPASAIMPISRDSPSKDVKKTASTKLLSESRPTTPSGESPKPGENRDDGQDKKNRNRSASRERRRSRSPEDRYERYHRSGRDTAGRRSGRSRSRSREHLPPRLSIDDRKLADAKLREIESRAYMNGIQQQAEVPAMHPQDVPPTPGAKEDIKAEAKEEGALSSPTSARKRDTSRDRERHGSNRDDSHARRSSKIVRNPSPVNIDRYLPSTSTRRISTSMRNAPRKRDRSRDRDHDKDRYSRDDRQRRRSRSRTRRSRSRSRSPRRDRDRDRDRERDRTRRSRSPDDRRDRDARHDKYRQRERSRTRSRSSKRKDRSDRDRERKRSRSRDHRRESRRE